MKAIFRINLNKWNSNLTKMGKPILHTETGEFQIPIKLMAGHSDVIPGRILNFIKTHVIMEFQYSDTKLRELYMIANNGIEWFLVYHELSDYYKSLVPDVNIPTYKMPAV